MRARRHTRFHSIGSLVCIVFIFAFLTIPRAEADFIIDVPPPTFTPNIDLDLSLSVNNETIAASSTTYLPTGTALAVSITAMPKPGETADWSPNYDAFDGTENSQTYWNAFYLDFYEGAIFSDATFISGEQMNVNDTVLKTTSTVTFPGPGTYSAVLYDSGQFRDYDALCSDPNITCYPNPITLEQVRAGIERGEDFSSPSFGFPPSEFLGVVTFTIPDDPCAVPGACASNVLFLPGIEGSRLYMKDANGDERKLWEPNTNSDISLLAMTESGASVNTIYTRDVIDKVFGWHTDIYEGFSTFMDGLVASSTVGMKEWKAYPYDWRYDVFDIVDNGSLKGDGSREYLINDVEQMASSSPTKKITLLAHSNGGLLAKALMIRLAQAGKEELVDKIIFVASPEVGTPKALFSLLHGYDQDYGLGFVADAANVRSAIKNFAGIYGLLPSAAYFNEISSPLANFNDETTVAKYRKAFGATLDSYDELTKFMLNSPATRKAPKADDLATPLPLNKKLVDKAAATHALIDAWRPPSGIAVNEIVGWGNETISTAFYLDKQTLSCIQGSVICTLKKILNYEPDFVIDGDGTVLSASAAYLNMATYFNLAELNKGLFTKNYKHADILSSGVLDSYIQTLLTNSSSPEESPYFSSTTPEGFGPRLVLVGAHSPVLISATDSAGRTTGIFPSPDSGSDLFIIKDEIPNSSVLFAGEGKYLSLPEDATVTVNLVGTGSGTVTLDTVNADGETLSSYENIPVVEGSVVETTLQDGVAETLTLDTDGDGTVDVETSGTFSVADTLKLLKERIAGISSLAVRNRLVALHRSAERYARDIRRAGKMLVNMEKIVRGQSGRTILQTDASAILILIQDLKNRR